MSLLLRLSLIVLSTVSLARAGTATVSVQSAQCFIGGFESAVRCVSIEVPRDWSRPSSGRIVLAAAVVPALGAGSRRAPLLVLPGGPGQAGTDLGPLIEAAFARARNGRDIILFDPRGTGRSTPLNCPVDTGLQAFDAARIAEAGRKCFARAASFGPEPALRATAQDIEALRRALGIPRFDLWGGSYGTKYAQAYARLFPGRVRAMVLDGALALDHSILATAAADADRAWYLLLRDCRDDRACHAAYPALRAEAATLLRAATVRPLRARIDDPLTGREREVTLDRMSLSNVIRTALYVPRYSALIPLAVHRAAHGDLSVLVALNEAGASWSTDTMSLGATAAVMCSEEVPPARADHQKTGFLIGTSYADYWFALCRDWKANSHVSLGRGLGSLDIPALVLVGALDPIAPLERAREVARTFPEATVVMAPAGGHTISTLGCAPDLIAAFLDDGSARNLDVACLRTPAARPPFATDGGTFDDRG